MKPEQSLKLANEIAAGQPWTNSLGVTFVPAGTDGVLFSIWDVRVKDYAIFVKEAKRDWRKPSFDQTENDPAVNVTWHDATACGDWLTKKERAECKFSTYLRYRLPTLVEWSVAVGNAKYPWGETWPPPPGAGNYAGILTRTGLAYSKTSPVGSFDANKYGLYDMGGNVWQWCEPSDMAIVQRAGMVRRARGASYYDYECELMYSECIGHFLADDPVNDVGFRLVVAPDYSDQCFIPLYDEELKKEQITKGNTQTDTQALQDPDLAKIVTAWPALSPELKKSILAILDSAKTQRDKT